MKKRGRIWGQHKRTFPAVVSWLDKDERFPTTKFVFEVDSNTLPKWMNYLKAHKMKVTLEGTIDY